MSQYASNSFLLYEKKYNSMRIQNKTVRVKAKLRKKLPCTKITHQDVINIHCARQIIHEEWSSTLRHLPFLYFGTEFGSITIG